MNEKLRNLRKAMDSTTHNGKHFTELQKNNIRKAIHSGGTVDYTPSKKYVIFGLTAVVVTIFAFLISLELIISPNNNGTSNGLNPVVGNDWEVRDKYVENNKVIFKVYPDPGLSAGEPYGYLFSFSEPFEVFKGKELAIYAQHLESGNRITALAPKKITDPSPGYSSLERFTHTFEVPAGGFWKYEVYVDDQFLGDVILLVNETKNDNLQINTESLEKIVIYPMKSKTETLVIEDIGSIEMIKLAVENAEKQPGIVNMANPEFRIEIGEETYFLWIDEKSGTIMNSEDTHTIYSLSENSIEQVNGLLNY